MDGMFCPFCTFGIEKRLKKLPETRAVRTDLAAGEAIVSLLPDAEFVEDHFADAIKRAGFSHSGIRLRTGSARETGKKINPSVGYSPTDEVVSAPDSTGFAFLRTIGKHGEQIGEFDQPMSVAFAPDGWFVVTDSGNARVQQFYADGRPWRQWSVSGDGKTPLKKPVGIAIGRKGSIWVSDYDADTINHYREDGSPVGLFGKSGAEPGEIDAPAGVAVTPRGFIAVADFYNHRLQLLNEQGTFLRAMGRQGLFRRIRSDGLNYPTRVTVSPGGVLWVADAYNHRVVAFDAEGNFVHEFGEKGHRPGEFDVTGGIAILSDNRLAVADFMNHRIQIWSSEGKFLADFGMQGKAPGEFERPTDVALSPDAKLYIVDWGNHRIQVFTENRK